MGFMSETKIIAGSSSYNLAGGPESRGNFLTSTVINLVMAGSNRPKGMGGGIIDAHLAGPAVKYKRFAKWAETSGYNNQVGNYRGVTFARTTLSQAAFDFLVPPQAGWDKRVVLYDVGPIDLKLITQSYILDNLPARLGQNFNVEQEMHWVTGGTGIFRRQYVPTGRLIVQFTTDGAIVYFTPPFNMQASGTYAYVFYERRQVEAPTTVNIPWTDVTSDDDFPEFVPQNVVRTNNNIMVDVPRKVVTTVSYSDGRPDEVTEVNSVIPQNFNQWTQIRTSDQEEAGTAHAPQISRIIKQYEETDYEIVNGTPVVTSETQETLPGTTPPVTKTTKVVTTTDEIEATFRWRRETNTARVNPWENPRLAIYQQGTSAYGDSVMFNQGLESRKFFPVIPIRKYNVTINASNYPGQYNWNRQACLKAFGAKKRYNEIVKSLESSGSINDVDHAWVVFGVSLGSKTDHGMRYLYEFFKGMVDAQPNTAALRNPDVVVAAWASFVEKVGEVYTGQSYQDEYGNQVSPPRPPVMEQYSVGVQALRGVVDWQYNVLIAAKGGHKVTGVGKHPRSKNKVGQCWVYNKRNITINTPEYHPGGGGDGGWDAYYTFPASTTAVIAFGKQVSENVWEEYELFDLMHTNYVHKGKNVITLAAKALANANEDTGFIVPLHETAFLESGLIDRTQLSLETAHLVLNYYEKQKIPWYATGFFKVIAVIVIIVISVFTWGAGAGAAGGVLGTNAAVGAALGLAGTAAIVAGAIANAIAAAIISAVISKASTALFGDKIGAIIGAIVSMVVVNLGSNNWNFDMSKSLDSLTSADNLMKMSLSGANMVSDHLNTKMVALATETQELQELYQKQMEEMQAMASELLGGGIYAQQMLNALRFAAESPEQFLARTMMNGDDIANITLNMVEQFPTAQLKLEHT